MPSKAGDPPEALGNPIAPSTRCNCSSTFRRGGRHAKDWDYVTWAV